MRVFFKYFSHISRQKRIKHFLKSFNLNSKTKLLDLGASNGEYTSKLIKGTKLKKKNIYIADIDKKSLEQANKNYGFKTILLKENQKIKFKDKYFDIVFSNSVIEHVTLKKKDIWNIKSSRKFKEESFANQRKFANEIIRLGKNFYVQTPNKYFLLETHSWLPFIQYLPRFVLIPFIKFMNKFWIKKTQPDWNLLDKKDMKKLFPSSRILYEKFLFLNKSIIAVKNKKII